MVTNFSKICVDYISRMQNEFSGKNFQVESHCPEIFPDFSGQLNFADDRFQEIWWKENFAIFCAHHISWNWHISAKIN